MAAASPTQTVNPEDVRLVRRFAEIDGPRLSHGDCRDMVDFGLAYATPGPRGTDYVLTDEGRAILRAERIAEGGAR